MPVPPPAGLPSRPWPCLRSARPRCGCCYSEEVVRLRLRSDAEPVSGSPDSLIGTRAASGRTKSATGLRKIKTAQAPGKCHKHRNNKTNMAPGKHHVVEDKEKHKIIPKVLEGSALIMTDWRDVPNRSKALTLVTRNNASPKDEAQPPRVNFAHHQQKTTNSC